MTEFTGERVIPGQVNVDLWNEHYSRYAFAARYATSARVLDLGCGSGYGSAELARTAASVTAIDISAEAVAFARDRFKMPNLSFTEGSATQIPSPESSFDLVTAFEVIEHLAAWPALITEAARVLRDSGTFVVSTPNKLYYAESRKNGGPNPFHEHEFELAEFRAALQAVFPHVVMYFQNRSECQVFYPASTFWPAECRIEGSGGSADDAHFFVAVCSRQPLVNQKSLVYVPKAANLLREREQHIEKLNGELALNQEWLADARSQHQQLLEIHREQGAHLEAQNRWALQLDQDLKAAQQRIAQLQDEFQAEQRAARELAASYETKVKELENENLIKTTWAQETESRLTAELEQCRQQLLETLAHLDTAEATLEERTRWALSLRDQVDQRERILTMIRASRWIKAGRTLGVGPQL